jgi:hypothetical protein
MKGIVLALAVVVASLALVAPAMALSEATCSAISQGTSNLSGPTGSVAGGIVSQNCPQSSAGNTPVVATSEPLGTLAVGLGLLGLRLLRRR